MFSLFDKQRFFKANPFSVRADVATEHVSNLFLHVDDAPNISKVHYSSKLRTYTGSIAQCASAPFIYDQLLDAGREKFEQ